VINSSESQPAAHPLPETSKTQAESYCGHFFTMPQKGSKKGPKREIFSTQNIWLGRDYTSVGKTVSAPGGAKPYCFKNVVFAFSPRGKV